MLVFFNVGGSVMFVMYVLIVNFKNDDVIGGGFDFGIDLFGSGFKVVFLNGMFSIILGFIFIIVDMFLRS